MTVVESPPVGTARPDGGPKVTGRFAFASDLRADHMLWGATLRSPHAHARVVRLDVGPALALPGVHAALTQDDIPGKRTFGLERADQPVLADGETRYWGEAVAVVAADDLDIARQAVQAIDVEFEALPPLVDSEEAERRGETFRTMRIRRGDPDAGGEVVVEGFYETPSVDPAALGTEAGLAIPDGGGGVDLWVVSQWLHADLEQIHPCLDLPAQAVRVHPAGIGGAFGSREDLTMHIHLAMLALRTGRPVKMVYDREESFVGHVHRHPARLWYRHEADRSGRLVRVVARVLLDGGAYASTSSAVLANAAYFAAGPYRCPTVSVDAAVVRTNNPPAGAMRGFGSVQVCFGYESQMDRLAGELGLDPLEIRRRNALAPGDPFPTTGQEVPGSMPVREVVDALAALPDPGPPGDDPAGLPGGLGLTTRAADVRRAVGYAIGFKNLGFSEGFDDFADARVTLTAEGAEVHTAAVEVGQGMVSVLRRVAQFGLGVERVQVMWTDTSGIGSAGSTSASRQTQMAGGAVLEAAQEVRRQVLEATGGDNLTDEGVWREGELIATLEAVCADRPISHEVRYRHPPTFPTDEHGQGAPHAAYAVAGHRAVVDVDPELGLVRVVRVDTVHDVGQVIDPHGVTGQVEGGVAQGMGLAVMEELLLDEGRIVNPTLTDYLLPTILDVPEVGIDLIEDPGHWGPLGAKGVGELPAIPSTAAVVAALRAATGRPLTRVPVRPEDLVVELDAPGR